GGIRVLSPMTTEEDVAAVLEGTRLGFLLTPGQVAQAVAWLAAFYGPELFQGFYETPRKRGEPQLFNPDFPKAGHHVLQLVSDFIADVVNGRENSVAILKEDQFAKLAKHMFKKLPLTIGNKFVFDRVVLDEQAVQATQLWGDKKPDKQVLKEQGKM